jgi:hypothetical protein
MNLSFSTKLCIVACHSDTPFKKKNIQHNHPLLKKIAHTIYINSSKYDKTIPMIHTSKRDKYAKYNYVLSTLNVHQYNIIIWMTDELLLTFSFVPLIQVALQRGYHDYKDIILQTPNYYLNPYPLSKINIVPAKEDPSLFKSTTPITPIHSISNEEEPIRDTSKPFTLNGSYTPSATLAPVHSISNEKEPIHDISNPFTLNGVYTPSSTLTPGHSISNEKEPIQETSSFKLLNSSYYPTKPVVTSHSISNEKEPIQETSSFKLLNSSYYHTKPVVTSHSISNEKEPIHDISNPFTLNGVYTPSATLTPVHSVSVEPQETSSFKLLNSSYYPTKPVVTGHSVAVEPQETSSFKLLNSSYYPTKPVVTGHSVSVEPQETPIIFAVNSSYTPSSTLIPVQSVTVEPTQNNSTFTLNGSYTPSTTITPGHSIMNEPQETSKVPLSKTSYSNTNEPTVETSNFKLSKTNYSTKPLVNGHSTKPVNVDSISQPRKEISNFKLFNTPYRATKPIVNTRSNESNQSNQSHIVPNTQKHMLSNTRVSFANILFYKNKSKPPLVYVKEIKPTVSIPVKETWIEHLSKIQQVPLPLRVDSMYETVLVSFQPLPYVEYCLRKMILHLPTWSHTVICGNMNTELITMWNLPINVISLDIDTVNAEQYNELMLMPSFWELFHGETLLLYQEDSRPLEYSVNPFLHHVYGVLEPGISIRSKSSIIRYLETNPPEEGISEQLYFKNI